MRARTGYVAAFGPLLLISSLIGCEATNLGKSPPDERFFFPSGVLLDPVQQVVADPTTADEMPPLAMDLPGSRYLYVANGNNDRAFNTGTLVAVDLQEFWRAWYDPHRDDPAQPACLDAIASGDVTAARAACDARDPRRGGVDSFCHEDDDALHNRCVLGPGSDIDESTILEPTDADGNRQHPCRRLPLLPHVVECDEQRFVTDAVHVGDFASTLAVSVEEDGNPRLWLPVRGDPSIAYIDVEPGAGDAMLQCAQGDDPLDDELCGDSHRLDQLRNDPELGELDREPFNTLVWERTEQSDDPDVRGERLAFVAHSDGNQLSVIDLDGVRGTNEPALVDLAPVFSIGLSGAGGFGLAARPCFEAGQGPLGATDSEPNVPAITQGCERPLIYSSMRFAGRLVTFTASGLNAGTAGDVVVPADERVDCFVPGLRTECRVETSDSEDERIVCAPALDREKCCPAGMSAAECDALPPGSSACCEGSWSPADPNSEPLACATDCSNAADCAERTYAGPYCATPDQIGQPCAIACEPRVRGSRQVQPSLLIDSSLQFSPILGDMAFADPRGDQLLVLQTNPGALLSLDTSLGDDGEPLDIPSAPPVEICAEPSRMKIYTERDETGAPVQRYALITCFRAALVYVVDLEALRVVDAVVVGTGPFDLTIDEEREVAYVINNLEFSISVLDLSRRRATRFQEMARLGLQDPFSQ